MVTAFCLVVHSGVFSFLTSLFSFFSQLRRRIALNVHWCLTRCTTKTTLIDWLKLKQGFNTIKSTIHYSFTLDCEKENQESRLRKYIYFQNTWHLPLRIKLLWNIVPIISCMIFLSFFTLKINQIRLTGIWHNLYLLCTFLI